MLWNHLKLPFQGLREKPIKPSPLLQKLAKGMQDITAGTSEPASLSDFGRHPSAPSPLPALLSIFITLDITENIAGEANKLAFLKINYAKPTDSCF